VEKIEWHDVQGLVLSGYPQLPFAAYIPWRFVSSGAPAKAWLNSLIDRVMRAEADEGPDADPAPEQPRRPTGLRALKKGEHEDLWAINVALTKPGLKKLGVDDDELSRFSPEFREGMAPQPVSKGVIPRRLSILGDVGNNSPAHWNWGGWKDDQEIDGILLLYARSDCSRERLVKTELSQMVDVDPLPDPLEPADAPLILRGHIWDDLKEHFGFRDGISQPIIEGTNEANRKNPKEARISVVKPGEFLLGYLNERGARVSYSSAAQSGGRLSNVAADNSRDLGRNGTYLVFRQLEQDVGAFRREVARTAKRLRGSNDLRNQEWVAARIVGRTQDGEPLIPPSADSPLTSRGRNDFLYYFEDRFGLRCPLGAHIRRANPRDIIGPNPDTALRLSKMHRIIRRGRPYGDRLPPPVRRKAIEDTGQRGMMFIALNADIAGQFELVQHTWINNGRFNGLYEEMDPLVHFPGEKRAMTIQRRPTSLRVNNLQQYITVRGGAYFFLPGIRALRMLAT
jgi:Dyp-type peroxidase family